MEGLGETGKEEGTLLVSRTKVPWDVKNKKYYN